MLRMFQRPILSARVCALACLKSAMQDHISCGFMGSLDAVQRVLSLAGSLMWHSRLSAMYSDFAICAGSRPHRMTTLAHIP